MPVGVQAVVGSSLREGADAAQVGVGADVPVGHAQGHPVGALGRRDRGPTISMIQASSGSPMEKDSPLLR